MDNTSQLKSAGTSMLSNLVLPDHCSQFSNMIWSSSNCMDIRQKNKITRILSGSILNNAAPEISANWILWWTQHDCCATNKVICLFKAPSMTNTGIELFHWLNSMIIVICLKPPPSFTMPPMLQAVKTTRKQLYQVLFFPFASTDKEMLSWFGPWFAKAVIFCRANLSYRPFLKAFKALSFLAPFAYTSIKLVTTVNKLVWYPI